MSRIERYNALKISLVYKPNTISEKGGRYNHKCLRLDIDQNYKYGDDSTEKTKSILFIINYIY